MDKLFNSDADIGDQRLVDKIIDSIRIKGQITFAEYMKTVLYDPDYGYYAASVDRIGENGDFITSSSLSPAFGALIGQWLHYQYYAMNHPKPFDIVEMGAGKGYLCASILSYLRDAHPNVYSDARYIMIDSPMIIRDPHLFGKRLFDEFPTKILSYASINDLDDRSVTGCFISNELPDAFPVHLISSENGRLREIFVKYDNKFYEIADELSDRTIKKYLWLSDVRLADGYRTEINLEAPRWIKNVSDKLNKGRILTIDYGYPVHEYYSPERYRGTLMCYYRHTYCEDPYIRIGKQDITAHVDFTSLIKSGESAGLKVIDFMTQRDFLFSLYTDSFIKAYPSYGRSVRVLTDSIGLGSFKVLVQGR